MDFFNISMRNYITIYNSLTPKSLSSKMIELLDFGFLEIGSGIFFKFLHTESVEIIMTSNAYFDLSGYEFDANKFHVEDYCQQEDVFDFALLFVDKFEEKWMKTFPDKICIACINFQSDVDMGSIATFSFYIEREGQEVIDLKGIDNYHQPIFIRKICIT